MTAHHVVVADIGPNATTGECACGFHLIAKHPRTLADVLAIHQAREQRKSEARDLVRFIDAHGGRLGAFRGYQQFTNTRTSKEE